MLHLKKLSNVKVGCENLILAFYKFSASALMIFLFNNFFTANMSDKMKFVQAILEPSRDSKIELCTIVVLAKYSQ